MSLAPILRAVALPLAALACGVCCATSGILAFGLLYGLDLAGRSPWELLLGTLSSVGPPAAVFAIPAMLLAPYLLRGARLWPSLPLAFLAAVAAATVVIALTGPVAGLLIMGPLASYAAGIHVLVRCRYAYPLAREAAAVPVADRLSRRRPA